MINKHPFNKNKMLHKSTLLPILLVASNIDIGSAFQAPARTTSYQQQRSLATTLLAEDGDNKAMDFLRKVGRVGGAANMDFANAMGIDESPSGGSRMDPSKMFESPRHPTHSALPRALLTTCRTRFHLLVLAHNGRVLPTVSWVVCPMGVLVEKLLEEKWPMC